MSKLLNFTVGNYRSFNENRTFTFCRTDGESGVYDHAKRGISQISAVYGANSSGKSNLIDAMATMRELVTESVRVNDGESLMYDPFILMARESKGAQCFECEFLTAEGERVRYGFKNTEKTIEAEWLFKTPASGDAELTLFLRESEGVGVNEELFSEGENFVNNLNPNRLFLSLVAQLGGKESKKVMNFFIADFNILSGLNASGYGSYTQKQFLNKTEASDAAKRFFRDVDLGFEDVEVRELPVETDFINDIPAEVRDRIPKTMLKTYSQHAILDEHGHAVRREYFPFSEFESDGTEKVFTLSGPIFDTLKRGSLLAIDELDAKLHPNLSRAIVKLFTGKETNPLGAQLLFTTHDSNLLNTGLLEADQIWFTEKDQLQATDLYRLTDIRMPDGSALPAEQDYERNYIHGRYGAIPFIRLA